MVSLLALNASSLSWLRGEDVNRAGESVTFLMQKIRETGYMQSADRDNLLICAEMLRADLSQWMVLQGAVAAQ